MIKNNRMEFSGNQFPGFKGTTLWTMACSITGGIYKANLMPPIMLDAITVDGSVTVITYAFLSAVIGYVTKKGLDSLFDKFKNK